MSSDTLSSSSSSSWRSNFIVVAPTFYASRDDPRFDLALQCCHAAARHNLQLLLVDASTDGTVCQQLQDAAALGSGCYYHRQQDTTGKKGAALREGIQHAYRKLLENAAARHPDEENDATAETVDDNKDNNNKLLRNAIIAFQEPEKVDLMRHWSAIVQHLLLEHERRADICVPQRSETTFRATYPIEQYHAEHFANLHLNALAAANSNWGDIRLDWTFGPVAFRASLASHWLDYRQGELWDAQLVPLVRAAAQQQQAKVTSYEIDFHHPAVMKAQEEGMPQWSHKRLFQLNHLFDKVGSELVASSSSALPS